MSAGNGLLDPGEDSPQCILCGVPLPPLRDAAYPRRRSGGRYEYAQCWCCPACVRHFGWRRAFWRARSLRERFR